MSDNLESQLKEDEKKLEQLKAQFEEVIFAEEVAAENAFQEQMKKFEEFRQKFLLVEEEKNRARKRWDEASKESKNFLKQINNAKGEINKIRKKLNLPDLEPEEHTPKGFIIFKKDKFEPEEQEKKKSEEK
jgi:esterase/lipase superfamily enzyme